MLMNIDICKRLSSRTFKFVLLLSYFNFYSFILFFHFLQKPVEFSPVVKHGNEYSFVVILRVFEIFVIDVRSFRGADCDTDHYLVVAKVREILTVRKQAAQKSDEVRFI